MKQVIKNLIIGCCFALAAPALAETVTVTGSSNSIGSCNYQPAKRNAISLALANCSTRNPQRISQWLLEFETSGDGGPVKIYFCYATAKFDCLS